MKLIDKENFEISLSKGSISMGEDYPNKVDEYYSDEVISAKINDHLPNIKVLTLRLASDKHITLEAKDVIAQQYLVDALKYIQREMINKTLKEVLDYDYGNAFRVANN